MENKQEIQVIKYRIEDINAILGLLETISTKGYDSIRAMNEIYGLLSQGTIVVENGAEAGGDAVSSQVQEKTNE